VAYAAIVPLYRSIFTHLTRLTHRGIDELAQRAA
jgi:hypothetical protein